MAKDRAIRESLAMIASPVFTGWAVVSWGWILFNSVGEPDIPGVGLSLLSFCAASLCMLASGSAMASTLRSGAKGWHVSLGSAAITLSIAIISFMLVVVGPVLLFAALPAMVHLGYLLAFCIWLAPLVACLMLMD